MMMMMMMMTMKRLKQKFVHRRSGNYAIHRVESVSSYLITPKGRISHFLASQVFAKPNYNEQCQYLAIFMFVPSNTKHPVLQVVPTTSKRQNLFNCPKS